METLLQDVGFAIRLLRRSAAFTAAAVLTLGLSIGANTAVMSAVQGVLVAPLPYAEPDRLMRVFEETPTMRHFPMAPADFRDYRDGLTAFDGLAAYVRSDLQLGDASRPEQLRGMQVSAGFFALLGYPPALGRDFSRDDELPANSAVAILSHALWMRRFNGDPAIVGTAARFSGRAFQIVGVLRDGFRHVGGTYRTYGHSEPVDIWTVLAVPREEHPSHRYSHYFNVVGRVKAGVSQAQLASDLQRMRGIVAGRYPAPNSQWQPLVVPLKQEIVGTAESTLMVLAAAAAAVLLLACVNVAGLLLGRAADRSREMGVRAALGATRGRLARQLLIESVVLAVVGSVFGVVFAYVAIAILARFGPADIPRLDMIAVNARVLAYALAATIVSALLFGFAPAWQLARAGVGNALRVGGRTIAGSPHQRVRRLLASVQLALAFVLVVASGLLLRSFAAMTNADPGFDAASTITSSIELPTARYDPAGSREFFRRARERVLALPGIRDAAFTSDLPWTGYDENTSFSIVGRSAREGEGPEARYHFATPGYTGATGTRLVAGRDLTIDDGDGATRVVLVNESAARKYWESPAAAVGARLDLWGRERTIAGVIGDVRDMPWHDRAAPALYFPQAQAWYPQPMFLVVKTRIDPASTIEAIRAAIREIDPQLPLAGIRMLDSVAGAALATRRLTLWLVAVFGTTALFLALVGIYGVMAQAVGRRRQEFGVRQALGATRADIVRLVMTSAATMTVAGLVAGVALAIGSTSVLASLLYQIEPLDPVTFAGVSAALLVTAALAAYVPAHRATRVNAAAALRSGE
jgi:putative ABC transport system permease protein